MMDTSHTYTDITNYYNRRSNANDVTDRQNSSSTSKQSKLLQIPESDDKRSEEYQSRLKRYQRNDLLRKTAEVELLRAGMSACNKTVGVLMYLGCLLLL